MSPASRSPRPFRLAVSALLVSLLWGCQTEIQHGLEEREANEILVLLDSYGIEASKSADGRDGAYLIRVADDDAAQSWRVLQAHGLPRRPLGGWLDAFGDRELISTPTEDRIRAQMAAAEALERSLVAIDGVVDAHVHLAVPTDPGFGRAAEPPRPSKASVLIITMAPDPSGGATARDGDETPDPDSSPANAPGETTRPPATSLPAPADDATPSADEPPDVISGCARQAVEVAGVRALVAGAIDGLEPEDVVVVATERRPLARAGSAGSAHGALADASASDRSTLEVVVGLLALLVAGLSAALVVVLLRRRRRARAT
jgi:type III secretion system YscJ/HrcJ family lipoprotein